MHELRRMQQLQTASEWWKGRSRICLELVWFFFFAAFFLNPISHQPGYRHHVIHCLPSLQVLDGKGEIYRHSEGRLTCHKKVCISVCLLCCQRWSRRRGRSPSRCTARSVIASSSLWPSADGRHNSTSGRGCLLLTLANSLIITQWKHVFAVF